MTRHISIIGVVVAVVLLSAPRRAAADTIWSWSFDQTEIVVGPTASVAVHATLFNSPLSTEAITQRGGASFTGDLQKTYDFTFGPDAQYVGLNVQPGDSFSFLLGTLKPIGGSVPPGTYPFCCEAHLGFGSVSASAFLPPLNTFAIRVVPEPPMFALWGVGVLPFVWRRVRAGGRA